MKVWKVPWLPSVENGFMTTEMYAGMEQVTVQSFMSENGTIWDDDILNDLCNERDRLLIRQIPIPMRMKEDTWYWNFEEDGEFRRGWGIFSKKLLSNVERKHGRWE